MIFILKKKQRRNTYDFFWNHTYHKAYLIFGVCWWRVRVGEEEYKSLDLEEIESSISR